MQSLPGTWPDILAWIIGYFTDGIRVEWAKHDHLFAAGQGWKNIWRNLDLWARLAGWNTLMALDRVGSGWIDTEPIAFKFWHLKSTKKEFNAWNLNQNWNQLQEELKFIKLNLELKPIASGRAAQPETTQLTLFLSSSPGFFLRFVFFSPQVWFAGCYF